MTLTVTAVSAIGDPTEFSCRFSVPLEDSSLLWTRWEDDRLVPLELPAVGEGVELSATKVWNDYYQGINEDRRGARLSTRAFVGDTLVVDGEAKVIAPA